jgi:cellulose synthase/poly-beta-1,6-N-acetylglucosamine synthase-like glycosyltransferase
VSLTAVGILLYGIPFALMVVGYVLYPALVALSGRRRWQPPSTDPESWPAITIVVPAFNEEQAIAATLENLLAADYPPDRRSILVVSDASTDGTDRLVGRFGERGVRLVRLPRRSGKTAAENVAGRHLRGSVVVNVDATIRLPADGLKALVRVFQDPTVGVASGRDVSTGDLRLEHNRDESTYVSYEMWVRRLETRAGSIVGASGCFYAIRRSLFDDIFPEALSRDFASPLIARELGFRSVSVHDAICFVPRTKSLRAEYRRKVRTMTRGLETLWFKRALLNPLRYGRFAWFLLGHKAVRWMVFLTLPLSAIGLVLMALGSTPGRVLLLGHLAAVALGALGYFWPAGRRLPRVLAVAGFVVSSHVAGFVAWLRALRRELDPVWEPTRRG